MSLPREELFNILNEAFDLSQDQYLKMLPDLEKGFVGSDETVTIPTDEYEDLKEDSEALRKLENAGVDNWEGYSYAFDGTFD